MGLDAVRRMEYPGRFIVLGRNLEGQNVVVYGITGRRESSRKRKFVACGDNSFVKVASTNNDITINEGNPDLLLYNLMYLNESGGGITVGNGRQTSSRTVFPVDSIESLRDLHEGWSYEDDPPIYTARISGILGRDNAGLGIIKRAQDGSAIKKNYKVPLILGEGRFISTYEGPDIPNPPCFEGPPRIIRIDQRSAKESGRLFYELFGERYRVSVAAVHANEDFSQMELEIINRNN